MESARPAYMQRMAEIIDGMVVRALRELSRRRHFKARSDGQKRRWAKQKERPNG